LIFVALDIIVQAYQACPARHAPAVGLAHIPTVARLLAIFMGTWMGSHPEVFNEVLSKVDGPGIPDGLVIVALGNGFIVTGMLWGGFLAELIDRRLLRSASYLLVLAFLSFFGIIHSSNPSGNMYKPWELEGAAQMVPYNFAAAYVCLAGLLALLSLTKESKEPAPEHTAHGGHFG
jgi:AGZA family xanthine/uracil permease-like MFS transporter